MNRYKVVEKMVKYRVMNRFIRKIDYLYLVDYAVSSSNECTSNYPKFPQINLLVNHIFLRIEALASPRRKYEGYEVIIQHDNAGRHNKDACLK